jgi:hypothetical protein
VSCALTRISKKKSADVEGITGKVIKGCGFLTLRPLLSLVNQSLVEGVYPESLKIYKVVPVFKNKGDRNKLQNYRPVSIEPQFGKLFEHVFCKRIIDYLDTQNIISLHQYGFQQVNRTGSI